MVSALDVPSEALAMVAQYLDTRDLKNAMLACKHFHNSMKDEISRSIIWSNSSSEWHECACGHSTWTRGTQVSQSLGPHELFTQKILYSDFATRVRRLKVEIEICDLCEPGVVLCPHLLSLLNLLEQFRCVKNLTVAGWYLVAVHCLPSDNLETLRLEEHGDWPDFLDIWELLCCLRSPKLKSLEMCGSSNILDFSPSPGSIARSRDSFQYDVRPLSIKRIVLCRFNMRPEHFEMLLGRCKHLETLILYRFDQHNLRDSTIDHSWRFRIPFELIQASVQNLWLTMELVSWRDQTERKDHMFPQLAKFKALKRLVLDSVSLFGKCDLGPADGPQPPHPRTKYLEDLLPETIEDLTLYTVLDYPDSHRDAIVQIEGYMQASVQGVKCLPCLTRICLISDYSAVVYERVKYDRSRFKCVKDCSEAWCGQRDVVSGCDLRSFHPPPMSRESTDADQSREESIAWSYSQELDLQTNAYLTDPFEFGI